MKKPETTFELILQRLETFGDTLVEIKGHAEKTNGKVADLDRRQIAIEAREELKEELNEKYTERREKIESRNFSIVVTVGLFLIGAIGTNIWADWKRGIETEVKVDQIEHRLTAEELKNNYIVTDEN